VMLSISIFAIGSYCPMCVATYVLSLATIILAFVVTKEDRPEKPERQTLLRWLGYSAAFIAIFGFLGGRVALTNVVGGGYNDLVRSAVLEWQMARPQTSAKVPAAAVGSEDTAFVVTEFADFLCGFCKNAAQRLEAFVKSRPDVRF